MPLPGGDQPERGQHGAALERSPAPGADLGRQDAVPGRRRLSRRRSRTAGAPCGTTRTRSGGTSRASTTIRRAVSVKTVTSVARWHSARSVSACRADGVGQHGVQRHDQRLRQFLGPATARTSRPRRRRCRTRARPARRRCRGRPAARAAAA